MKKKFRNSSLVKGPKNLIFIVLFFIISITLLTKLADYTRHVKKMAYSTFLNKVEEGAVKSVHIEGQTVVGYLKNGTPFEAAILDSPNNIELLRKNNVEFSVTPPTAQLGFWYFLLLIIFGTILFALWYFIRQSRGSNGGSNIFSMSKSRAKMFMPSSIDINFNSVAGAHHAKRELQDIVDFLKNPEKYKRLGAKIPKGVLLVGEPGNGKTLLAKAVAGEANCPFFSITGSDFIEVFVGVGAARVRDLFIRARRHAPCIVFIDEIDAIGRQRSNIMTGHHEERDQTLNQLLTEMDGFDGDNASIIVIAATNMPEVLDKALLRPGRFDRLVDVPYPDEESREKILKIHATSLRLDSMVDFKTIAAETAGFSGADLANLMNKAAITASKKGNNSITMEDLQQAHKEILQGQNAAFGNSTIGSVKGNSKARMFMPAQVKTKFSDVAGLQEVKEELQDFIEYLKNPEKYKRLGAKITKGVLLVGDPGNGKTLLAKAVAGEANCPFFNVSASEFVEVYVGVGASRVRELFAQARKHTPSILFIDEIDAVGMKRNAGLGGHEERNQTLNQLLTEMDGFDSEKGAVIVLAATNRPETLDPALLRAGRFDRQVYVPYPDLNAREKVLALHAAHVKLDPTVNLIQVARGTAGFSAADLANLINEAALHASRDLGKDCVSLEDFEEARDKIILGKKSQSLVMSDEEKKVTAYHESGHALVRLLIPEHSDPLYKLTIIPRGSALGVTHAMPEREKYMQTKEEIETTIMVCLGGRVAEELEFNLISTGASNDFEKATEMARHMVCRYGMSSLGLAIYKQNDQYQYSQEVANKIDIEVERILTECYQKVTQLLQSNRDKLTKLAVKLLEKETLFASEVYELLGLTPRQDFKFA